MRIVILEDVQPTMEQVLYLTRAEHEMCRREYDAMTHMVDKPSFETWMQSRHFGGIQNLPVRTQEFVKSVAPGVWGNK